METDLLNLILRFLRLFSTDFDAVGREASHLALDRATLGAAILVTKELTGLRPLAGLALRNSRARHRVEIEALPDVVLATLALPDGLLPRDHRFLTDTI